MIKVSLARKLPWRDLSRPTIGLRHYKCPSPPFIHIPKANVYRFGDSNTARPVFQHVQWTVHEGEAWAIVGSGPGEKTVLFQTLLGHLRLSPAPPPPGGLFPMLSAAGCDPYNCLSIVGFGNRQRLTNGAFYDYTARYGSVWEEDRITLRQTMFPETMPVEFQKDAHTLKVDARSVEEIEFFETLVDKTDLKHLLDLPMIALSNGQTRRARIVKAVLRKPELLLLDEPLTGLDGEHRPKLLEILRELHNSRSPRIIMGLRVQDIVPDWITHIAFIKNGRVTTGRKEEIPLTIQHNPVNSSSFARSFSARVGKLLVDMKNVNIKYGSRTVLSNIEWEIRQGERWHLRGANGSGKTTLLSLLTGDHPQSWTQPHLYLPSPSLSSSDSTPGLLPRKRIPTPILQSDIGLVSPELFDAFPRRSGMSVWEAVGTGFNGGFVPLGKDGIGGTDLPLEERERRMKRCWDVLEALGPASWNSESQGCKSEATIPTGETRAFAATPFVSLPAGAQRMVLLMRALVGEPPLVLLDEVWSGMDFGMLQCARRYLREKVGDEQAVVVITHWEEEVPWTHSEGLKTYVLEKGVGKVLEE